MIRLPSKPSPAATPIAASPSIILSVAMMASIVLAAAFAPARANDDAGGLALPYERFELDNGLRVVVHEDRKAPLVAVSVWYHVGSKDEPEGKTGFAHLFEHIMFNGSEHYDGEWFEPLEEVGATGLNGTTWFDRTNYFQTVPTPALERVLWMESDRMGHLLGALTQEKLDNQRGVVQNEKRQGDNRPYGRSGYAILNGLLPEGHPYSHSTIGSIEDLNAASLEDVKEWFRQYYGAANTVLVLAGDIDAETARPLAEKYFGHIEAGPPLTRTSANAPRLAADKKEVMYDRSAPQPRLSRNWVAPGRTSRDAVLLQLAAQTLGGGKTSRLYRRLVDELQLATSATAAIQPQEVLSFYSVTADAKKDADLDRIESEIDAVLEAFLERGPTRAELDRAKTGIKAGVIRGLEQVGGKASILARGALYADDPGFILKQLDWLEAATPQDVLRAARDVMTAGAYQLTVLPFKDYSTTPPAVDRTAGLPAVTQTPDLVFPAVEETTLSNGVKVVLAERRAVPVVEIAVQFDAGYAADAALAGRPGGNLGAASFTGAMLDEGAGRRSAVEIAEDLDALGAQLGAGSTLDTTTVSLSALTENLRPSLAILADVVRNPTFDEAEIDKLRGRWLAGIEREKANPADLAMRVLPPEIYGDGHAYGAPLTGSGTAQSIGALTRDDLAAFHEAFLRPDNATIFVVGDASIDEIKPELERAFGSWRAPAAPIPAKNIAPVARPDRGKVIIIDKPDAPQSLILAAHVAPPSTVDNNVAIIAMNDIIGGEFTSRVNMNLREDKGWAYGAYTFLSGARGQRPFMVYAPVQTDKTAESLAEIIRELNDFRSGAPATEREIKRSILGNTRSLPGSFETAGDVLASLVSSARYERSWDYPSTLTERFNSLAVADIQRAAQQVIHTESLTWVVVGDREKIEADIRALDIGPIEVKTIADL